MKDVPSSQMPKRQKIWFPLHVPKWWNIMFFITYAFYSVYTYRNFSQWLVFCLLPDVSPCEQNLPYIFFTLLYADTCIDPPRLEHPITHQQNSGQKPWLSHPCVSFKYMLNPCVPVEFKLWGFNSLLMYSHLFKQSVQFSFSLHFKATYG